MARPKQQEGGKNTSVTLYGKHFKMLKVLVEEGYYEYSSEIVREGIEKVYAQHIANTEEELTRLKDKLERTISELEQLKQSSIIKADEIVSKYLERKVSMTARGLSKYEENSKYWIKTNLNEISMAFPGLGIDDIYKTLEEKIKVKQ